MILDAKPTTFPPPSCPAAQAKWPSLKGILEVKSGVGARWEGGGIGGVGQGNITTKGGGIGGEIEAKTGGLDKGYLMLLTAKTGARNLED